MIYIYKEVKDQFNNNRLKLEQISKHLEKLEKNVREVREYILKTFYDEEKNSFVRNLNDRKIDISLLGSVIPFGVLPPKDKKVLNTIERIDMTLRTYTGGYVRYENDGYMGGRNPWPIATLWMAEYNLEAKEYKKAMENFAFVTNSCSDHGLLGEQVNNETMKPEWVIGLTWSHAMYVIVLEMLIEKGLL
jgi:GH15 family glucan-1,4-alpha-glucosidase